MEKNNLGTLIEINPKLLQEALDLSNYPTPTELIEAALQEYIQRQRQLDDREEFASLLQKTCKDLNDETELKVLLLGMGDDVNSVVEDFLDLDFNVRKSNVDKDGNPCDIFIFDLVKEIEDILDPLGRQLGDNPDSLETLPKWVKDDYPEWYQKYVDLIESNKKK
ncbi:type II toxin-antitoxin system VapB family antitoxin [Roseofilum capinflatum]|uniref:Type II toxin-antitoxin system VapB family antitoxin n=1 Tax=Roseofilum capinflatum BLCC-M114 TaxID=3022440 RepID=A0ABT7B3B1_9CYAN|nr:type II toxin-antitoxin system VapB family antitoxin [Roseofilum capinflatum]MDJ1173031.1 type II toxin-antitoxin system VapB family antitoxin [Roseofilum capinflatum BLCC-M114]